jgi:hypothetical protein
MAERLNFENSMVKLIESFINDIHTSCPGKIVEYNKDKQTCTVQPCIKNKYSEQEEYEDLPLLLDVPVLFPGSGDFFLTWDIKPESYCWLMFAERSIENWIIDGGLVEPASFSTYDLSDAVAFVGINPNPEALAGVLEDCMMLRNRDGSTSIKLETDAITVTNAKGSMSLDADGVITLTNESGNVAIDAAGKVTINSGNFTVDA